MGVLQQIIGAVYVLDVRFHADGTYVCEALRCKSRGEPERIAYDLPRLAKGAVCITVSGFGVVSKPADSSGIAAQVTADPETFVTSETGGILSFVRRERLRPLLDELTAAGVFAQRIAVEIPVPRVAGEFFESLRWRQLIGFDDCASALAQAAVKRLMVPMLGLFLLLLGANAVLSAPLQTEQQKLRTEREALSRNGSEQAGLSAERERLYGEFSRRLPVSYAVLCDRIGACVPQEVRLTALDVEPLLKRFEAEKPLQRRERTTLVTGECDTSEEIGRFTEALSGCPGVRGVRLSSVERNRDSGLNFRVELEL